MLPTSPARFDSLTLSLATGNWSNGVVVFSTTISWMIVPWFWTLNFTLPAGADVGVTVMVMGPFKPCVSPTTTVTVVVFAFVAEPPAAKAALAPPMSNARLSMPTSAARTGRTFDFRITKTPLSPRNRRRRAPQEDLMVGFLCSDRLGPMVPDCPGVRPYGQPADARPAMAVRFHHRGERRRAKLPPLARR